MYYCSNCGTGNGKANKHCVKCGAHILLKDDYERLKCDIHEKASKLRKLQIIMTILLMLVLLECIFVGIYGTLSIFLVIIIMLAVIGILTGNNDKTKEKIRLKEKEAVSLFAYFYKDDETSGFYSEKAEKKKEKEVKKEKKESTAVTAGKYVEEIYSYSEERSAHVIWECRFCGVENKREDEKCVVCGEKRS